jgi:uncharacterized protein (TIGR03083 family)
MTRDASLLSAARDDGNELLRGAAVDFGRVVPDCPGWTTGDLVGHLGGIFSWIARIVTTGQSVDRKDREVPPENLDERAEWYARHLDGTVAILGERPPETPTWTFSSRGVHDVGWWWRRIAVETAIHRWDVQHAAQTRADDDPGPLARDVSAAGIEEFLVEFLPGMLAKQATSGLNGSLHLHATDRSAEWTIDLGARGNAVAQPGHATADTELQGTTSDLLLFLTNRGPTRPIAAFGRPEVLDEWRQLRR